MAANGKPTRLTGLPNRQDDPELLVRVEGVTRVYRRDGQEVQAVRGVDLALPRGVLAALKGRSGSGKTTLLNLIGGLDRPTSGTVSFDGVSLSALDDRQLTSLRRERMGFVFQSFALLPTYSAFENVELMLRLTRLNRRERSERARRCLTVVGLEKWMDHRPDEMSGGQRRLAIARALSTRPALILADEPTEAGYPHHPPDLHPAAAPGRKGGHHDSGDDPRPAGRRIR
jgi:ABC-type lipoprotein export system ATPase subunit